MSVRYGRIDYRVADALEAGAITFSQFGILAFLECRAKHSRGPEFPEINVTLRELADRLEWPWGTEKLRRDLRALRDDGWLSFEVGQGKRTKYHIRLKKASVKWKSGGSPVEVGTPAVEVETGRDSASEHDYISSYEDGRWKSQAAHSNTAIPNTQNTDADSGAATANENFFEGQEGFDPTDPISALVREIRTGKDARTETTYRKRFEGRRTEASFRRAAEKLRDRRKRTDRQPLVNEAAYVYSELQADVDGGERL